MPYNAPDGTYYGQDNPRDQVVVTLAGAHGWAHNIKDGTSGPPKINEVLERIEVAMRLLREYPDPLNWPDTRP